jgi:hypothetical protein
MAIGVMLCACRKLRQGEEGPFESLTGGRRNVEIPRCAFMSLGILLAMAGPASATVVNISAVTTGCTPCNGSPHPQVGDTLASVISPVQLTLDPGTYTVTNGDGALGANPDFTAWNFNSSGNNWIWTFLIINDANLQVIMDGCCGAQVYSTQAAAAADPFAQNFSQMFMLTQRTTLDFVTEDYGPGDNLGGVALEITPEPSVALLHLASIAGFVSLGALRKRSVADLHCAICVLVLAALPAAGSQLDTLVTSDAANACTPGMLRGTVSATLPFNLCQPSEFLTFGAGASASAGFLSLGTSASASWHDQLPGGSISASATAQAADVVTVGGGNPGDTAFLEFQFEITGTNSAILLGMPGPIGTSVGSSFTNLIACDFNPNLLPIAIGCPGPAPDAVLNFGAIDYLNHPVQVEVPVPFGVPWGIYFELYSTTGAVIEPDLVVNFDGSSSFGGAQITSVSVLDSNHQPISSPTLVADSGTVYPIATSAVPGPASDAIALLGLAGVWVCRKRGRGFSF